MVTGRQKKNNQSLDYSVLVRLLRQTLSGADEKADIRKLFPDENGGCFYSGENGSISLSEEATKTFHEFQRALSQDPQIGPLVSMNTISTQAAELLIQMTDSHSISDEDLRAKIKELAQKLRATISEWRIFVPVDNLDLAHLKKIKIGRVILHDQGTCLSSLKRSIAALVGENRRMTATAKRGLVDHTEKNLERWSTSSGVIAEVVVTADSNAASGLAQEEVSTALNLLRLYTPLIFRRDAAPAIGLRGANPIVIRPYAMLGAKDPKWFFGGTKHGLDTYELTSERLNHIRKHGSFNRLSLMLAKTDMTTMESMLARGVRWIGQGILAVDPPAKVLHFAVALELMMTEGEKANNDEGGITHQVATRLAHLLGRNLQDRATVFSEAARLYDLRSHVAHEGETDITTADVMNLETYAIRALLRLAKHLNRWPEHKDFRDWVRNRELR